MPTATPDTTDMSGRQASQGKTPYCRLRAAAGWILTGAALLAAFARLGANWFWVLDLLANLAAQVALATGILLAWWLVRRQWALAAAALVAFLIAITGVWTPRAPRSPHSPRAHGESSNSVRVLVYNAHAYNQSPLASYQTIMNSGADVVALSEPTPELLDLLRLPATREVYPHAWLPEAARGGWRIMLSRWPQHWEGPGTEGWKGARGLALHGATWATVLERPEGRFAFVHIHPISPRTKARWVEGNQTLRIALQSLQEQVAPLGIPIIMGGDLNSTPSGWRSREIDRFGLVRRSKPLLAAGTYPAWSIWPLTVAIDDVWVSCEVKVIRWQRHEPGGSDHFPVIVDLALPQR